jgi:hypothetical protein
VSAIEKPIPAWVKEQIHQNERRRQRVKEPINSTKPATNEGYAAWDDPDLSLLDDRRGNLPDFPIDTFSPRWRGWIDRSAHGAGVTPAHVAIPLLGMVSALIGGARRAKPSKSWSQPCTSWVAIVGFSGTGKTPVIDVTKRGLTHIERVRKGKIAELEAKHETKVESAKAVRAKWKEAVEAAVEGGQQPPPRPVEAIDPGPFVAPRLYISNATIERLAILLKARPVGMLLLADELAGLFLNMGRYSNGSDREFWLESWNGNPYIVERMGRPAVNLDNLLIGLVGGLQPDKLAKSFDGSADGMYARVLFAWPPEPVYRPLSNEVSEVEPEIINALARIIDLPAQDDDGNLVPHDVPLSAEAVATFEQFRQFLHGKKAGLDGREREWVAKAPAHVLRLSCTLAYLDWAMDGGAEPSSIDAIHIEAAVRLWKEYFLDHARAALRLIGLSERHVNARRVLRWLKANASVKEISVKDVRRDALAQSLDAKQTEELLDGLAKAGWLKRKPAEQTGGRAIHRWQVNPFLYSDAESAQSAERFTSPTPRVLPALPALPASGNDGVICAQCGAGLRTDPPSDAPTIRVKDGSAEVWLHAIGCHRTWIEDHRQ